LLVVVDDINLQDSITMIEEDEQQQPMLASPAPAVSSFTSTRPAQGSVYNTLLSTTSISQQHDHGDMMAMGSSSARLLTTSELLRSKEIPWEIYQTARLISDRDLQLLRRYDKKDAQHRKMLLSEGGARYVRAMMSVLQNVTKEETVQYVLAMVDDILDGDSSRARFFFEVESLSGEDDGSARERVGSVYNIFLRLLQRDDWYTQAKAAFALSMMLSHRPHMEDLNDQVMPDGRLVDGCSDDVAKTMASFIDWCLSQLRRPSHPQDGIAVSLHSLSILLREKPARRMVYKVGGVGLIMSFVGSLNTVSMQQSVQVQYESILCVWLLSLYHPNNDQLSTPALVSSLVDIVRLAHKEKVIRISLMTLKSILAESGKLALEMTAVENGLVKTIENRLEQTWEDPDIPELLQWLQDRIDAGVLAMSSLERYRKEIMQGVLVPGPMHESEQFWSENAEKLYTENNASLLKALLKLLDASRDSMTLALACKDISNFVTYFPHGKGIVADLEGKALVMRLMAHPDAQVQTEALICVQKLLLSSTTLGYMVQAGDS
jgi:V-type H+-transporting ATPase subunit H